HQHFFPTRRSSDLVAVALAALQLAPQCVLEIAAIVQPGQGVGDGTALDRVERRGLDDRRVDVLRVNVEEEVEQSDAPPHVAPQTPQQLAAVPGYLAPQ